MPNPPRALRTSTVKTKRKSTAFYTRKRWRNLRAWFLRRNPLCADPHATHATENAHEFATEVDHIIPRSQAPELEYSVSNLQALCHVCHSRKTAKEKYGYSQHDDPPAGDR